MTEEELKLIINHYKLSPSKLENILDTVYQQLTFNKTPRINPTAVVVGGQPGAGKTGLIGFTEQKFKGKAVLLDIDDFRYYHPKIDEIVEKYPNFIVPITAEMCSWVSVNVTPKIINGKFDVVMHKTMKDDVVVHDTLLPLKEKDYTVVVKALAVSDLESFTSAFERSQAQLNHCGWCRWVTKPNHEKAYKGLVETINNIEQNQYCDHLEIYTRGKIPCSPNLVYAKTFIEENQKNDFFTNNFQQTNEQNSKHYDNAKQAIEEERILNAKDCAKTLPERISVAESLVKTSEESNYLADVKCLYQNFLTDQSKVQ